MKYALIRSYTVSICPLLTFQLLKFAERPTLCRIVCQQCDRSTVALCPNLGPNVALRGRLDFEAVG